MEIQLDKQKKWFYRLISKNKQTVLVSETYYSKWNAKRAAKKMASINGFKYTECR